MHRAVIQSNDKIIGLGHKWIEGCEISISIFTVNPILN